MENGLFQCEISPGQFTGEYAVSGVMFDGEGFSLFATQSDLRCSEFPENDQPVPGLIQVEILDEAEGLMLIRLPQRALENGDTLTVRADRVQKIPNPRPQKVQG